MAPVINKRLLFNEVPQGLPTPGKTTVYDDSQTIDTESVQLNGGFLVKTLLVSLDFFIIERMLASGGNLPGLSPIPLGGAVENYGVGVVLRSENPKYKTGQHVYQLYGFFPFQEYFVVAKDEDWFIINNEENIPWQNYVSVLGMPGQTAYLGWKAYAKPKKGEIAFVTSGAGTVGSVVAQLAKLDGLKVIASAGSDEKVQRLKDIGVDVAFNHKTTDTKDVLAQHGPIDIYWDNVGGATLEAALEAANRNARFIECGMISNNPANPYGVKSLLNIIHKSITVNGFVIPKLMLPDAMADFYETVPKLVASGKLQALEDVREGLEKGGEALVDALTSSTGGKVILRLAQ